MPVVSSGHVLSPSSSYAIGLLPGGFSMKQFASFVLACFVCFCLLIATERRALAYVDPSTGYLALQSAASALAAVGYFMRRRILGLFSGGSKKSEPAANALVTAQKGNARKAA
jgi:hypothetical protein